MQKESPGGPDNFSNIQSHRDYLLDIFNNACNLHVFQTNDDPMYDGSVHLDPNHVPDVKLRLNVIEINFIQDNRGWNNDGSISGHYNYTTNPRKNDAALNIFICEGLTVIDPTTGQIKLWGLGGIGNSQYVMMNGMHKVYQTGNAPSWSNLWMQMGELLAHEVGHTLGLSHSWVSCSAPQFDDIDPCPHSNLWCYPLSPTPIGQPPCLNNCMGYSALRRWFSPKQIGAMHRNLTNRDISRFVRHEIVINNNIAVTSDQTWTVNRYVFGDIVVKPGYTLTIKSKVFLPIAGKIIVERGARLNLECAYLTTCRAPLNSLQIQTEGDYWSGIKVWGNTALPHLSGMSDPTTPLQPNYAGRLISNTSKIHNAREAIALFNTTEPWPNSQYYYGGFVYANETEFKNNRRSAAFMKYDFDYFHYSKNASLSRITMIHAMELPYGAQSGFTYLTVILLTLVKLGS